ncbi:PAS domain S-box protein [Aminipila butyrica]|uniref:histidine kinase n=1 Tax=Aminipila butyrica TaxID=433296 RepID=A0A858C1U6_9FIRM|nr:ATP-binding protein [Aminipila butyrica]QIB70616.1 PAS domain S-box protein [Aminipila butyrica]
MRTTIFKNFFFLSAAAILVTTLLISVVMYKGFYRDMRVEVEQEAKYIGAAVDLNGASYLQTIEDIRGDRVTLIASDGTVVFDNRQKPSLMENHLDRPEVAAALTQGSSEGVRMSETLGQQTFYHAIKLADGSILRVANTTSNVYTVAAINLVYVALICLVMLILIWLLAKGQTEAIVAPINRLDLENPLSNQVYDEFSPLLRKLEQQNRLIQETYNTLKRERDEFQSITQNMNEGLIVLNGQGEMLLVNKRAGAIFGKAATGHYLTLNRSAEFREVAEKALQGTPAESQLSQGGRIYHLLAAPSAAGQGSDGQPEGAVVLALDVTEKEETDHLRREFSGNVSHELKTPLTSILGYAEIMKAGIVPQADMPDFAAKIYSEAKRMIALVEDILKLSKLDEGLGEEAHGPVDLQEVCKGVMNRLEAAAEAAQVSLEFDGTEGSQPVYVMGSLPMLDELVFNLCENAIKYNKRPGQVKVTLTAEPVCLTVADTGIGIAREHQERVFERFYRVDKSHSKMTGGTGLGLSIVKHVVKRHGAALELESQQGKGTTIRVCF